MRHLAKYCCSVLRGGGIGNLEDIAQLCHSGVQGIIVIDIDNWYNTQHDLDQVNQYTDEDTRTQVTTWQILDWVK